MREQVLQQLNGEIVNFNIMKKVILITILLFGYASFSMSGKEISLPDYWEFVSVTKDSSISQGHSKIKILILEKYSQTPLNNVQLFINTETLLGQTDSSGTINSTFKSGDNLLCADTPDSNRFSASYNFLEQHYYVITVRMDQYKQNYFYGNGIYEVADKPVIYLYPTKKQKINVQVTPKNDFLFTYPQYPSGGWNVSAFPSGKIEYNDRRFNYLFWEGTYPPIIEDNQKTGFVVNSDTLIEFFEHTLTTVGLNNLEQADFITYWGPKLMENQLNFIHFYFNEDVERHVAQLKISPTPKSLIRIFMTYHGMEEEEYIIKQAIPSYKRNGFTAIEWGGSYH